MVFNTNPHQSTTTRRSPWLSLLPVRPAAKPTRSEANVPSKRDFRSSNFCQPPRSSRPAVLVATAGGNGSSLRGSLWLCSCQYRSFPSDQSCGDALGALPEVPQELQGCLACGETTRLATARGPTKSGCRKRSSGVWPVVPGQSIHDKADAKWLFFRAGPVSSFQTAPADYHAGFPRASRAEYPQSLGGQKPGARLP